MDVQLEYRLLKVELKKENEELPKTGLKTTDTFGIALLSLGIVIAIRRKQRQ